MSIVNQPLAFVDIETSGGSWRHSRVIEVAVIRVERSRVVDSYQTLIDPGEPLSWMITGLTGITDNELEAAPTFRGIADRLAEILDGCIFVAHNVNFDYSFVRQEFARLNVTFNPPKLCTVRLSRKLFPDEQGHSLDKLIARHQLSVANRHRAYGDAQAIWDFYQLCLREFDLVTVEAAAS